MARDFNGTTITKCFEVVALCGKEIEALCETLDSLFLKKISSRKPSEHYSLSAGGVKEVHRTDDSGWIVLDVARNFPFRTRKKQKTEMYLGYQISLVQGGIALPKNNEPLLHVFFWNAPVNFEEMYIKFPFGDDLDRSCQVVGNKLVVWGEAEPQNWTDREWIFSVKLTSLNSNADLLERVVIPALALLDRAGADQALPDGLPGLVLYPDVRYLLD